MKITTTAIFFVLIAFMSASAQNSMPQDRTKFYKFGDNFIFDSFAQPYHSGDSVSISVFYKISYDALVFSQKDDLFISIVQVEFAFKDESGIIRRRKSATDTIYVATFEESKDRSKFCIGQVEAVLPISDYSIAAQVFDSKSQSLFKASMELKNISKFTKSHAILQPIFATQKNGVLNVYQLQGSIPFSSAPLTIMLPISFAQDSTCKYSISKKEDKAEANWGEYTATSGEAKIIKNTSLAFSKSEDIIAEVNYGSSPKDSQYDLLTIELSGNSFVPGNYLLTLGNSSLSDTLSFKVVWEDMPLSLRDVKYALKVMEYILTDEEISTFRSYSNRDLLSKIMEYWRKYDPTADTPYNEAMAEYFKRVDYAFFNFQSISEKDGALTDRGMIYILFGKPDSISSALKDGKHQEVWLYRSLIKEFTFDLISAGVYKLSDIKE